MSSFFTSPTVLNTAGLVLNLAGVLLLFRYGMPFRVAQINEGSLWADKPTERDRSLNRRYTFLGVLGLCLLGASTGLQVAAALANSN